MNGMDMLMTFGDNGKPTEHASCTRYLMHGLYMVKRIFFSLTFELLRKFEFFLWIGEFLFLNLFRLLLYFRTSSPPSRVRLFFELTALGLRGSPKVLLVKMKKRRELIYFVSFEWNRTVTKKSESFFLFSIARYKSPSRRLLSRRYGGGAGLYFSQVASKKTLARKSFIRKR